MTTLPKEIKEAIWLLIDLARQSVDDDPGDIADMQEAAIDLLERFIEER